MTNIVSTQKALSRDRPPRRDMLRRFLCQPHNKLVAERKTREQNKAAELT